MYSTTGACFAADLNIIRTMTFNKGIELGSKFFQLLFDIVVCPVKISIKLVVVFV